MSIYDISERERRRRAQEMAQLKAMGRMNTSSTASGPSSPTGEGDEEKGFWASTGDLFGNILKGALKGIEGIYDFGASVVGEVGGWFDEGFKEDVRKHVEYDFTGAATDPWLKDLERQSYLGEDSFLRNVAQGVGGMLPAVVTGYTTHIGAVGTGMIMAGAAGQGTEEAFKSGADYESALFYGAGSGAVEGLTEKIGGFTFGGTSKLGKAVAGTRLSKGLGKVTFDAVSEGAEEVLADYIDPALKYATGVDKNIGENYLEAAKNTGKTFLTGAAVGSAMQGGQTLVRSGVNKLKGRGGVKATRADNAVANIIEATGNYNENRDNNFKVNAAVRQNLSIISQELVKMSPEARKNYLESIGATPVKNGRADSSPTAKGFLQGAFNEDGTISEGVFSWFRNAGTNAPKNQYYSHGVAGKRDVVRADMEKITGELREGYARDKGVSLEEAAQVIPDVKIYEGELTAKEQRAYSKFKEGFNILNRVGGEGLNFVMVDSNSEINGTLVDGKTVYMAKDTFTNGTWAKTLVHEYTHFAEGSREYERLVKLLSSNSVFTKTVSESLMEKGYGFDSAKLEAIREKRTEGKELTKEEIAYYEVYRTELNAHLSEELLGNEQFIGDIVVKDKSLAARMLHKIKNLLSSLGTIKDDNAREQHRFLKKAENLYLNAIHRAGYKYVNGRIVEDEEKKGSVSDAETDNGQIREATTGIKFSKKIEEYPYSMQTVIKEYLDAVDTTLLDAAEKLRANKNSGFVRKNVCKADEDFISDVKESFGLDVNGFKIQINSNAFNHIEKRHGLNGKADKSMADLNDVARIGYIIENRDSLEPLLDNGEQVYSKEFQTKEDTPAPMMLIKKKINGTYYCAIAVTDGQYKKVWVQTAFINKRDGLTQVLHDEISSLSLTPEAVPTSHPSNAIIDENKENINTFEEKSEKKIDFSRKSKEPTFEGVEGGVKINFDDFDTNKSNDNSNDFEAAENARREGLDALLTDGEPPRYSPVSTDTDTALLRKVVNNTKAKKYTRADVKAIVTELLSSEGYFGDNTVVMKGKQRAELEKMLWQALNTKGKGELGGAALDAAEYIIQNAIAVEYLEVTDDIQLAVQFVDALKPYLHNMNLDFIKGDIKAKFDKDKTPYLMWAVKKDSSFRGYTADEVAGELEALGFRIDKTNEADIFLEIDELYRLAKQTITDAVPTKDTLLNALGTKKAKKLKQALARDILTAQEEKGTETSFYKLQQKYIKQIAELGDKVKTAHKRNTLENRILKEAKKIYDSNKHTFANATEVQTEALKNIKSLLSRVNSREQVNRSSLRAIMKELAIWYSEKNPVLEGFYDNYIAEHLAYFAESEVEETISEGEDNGQSRTPVPTPENVKREKPLSMGELEMVQIILHHMNHVFENFGKMWRGGKYVEASDVASAQYDKLKEAEANHSSFEKAILHNKALRYIMDPMAVLAAWDGHDADGYFTTTYREFAEGLIGQRWDEMQALAEFDEFRKTHKKYFKTLTNGNDKIKVSGRIDPRNLSISEIEIPKNVAIDLYMVSKTGQAIVTLEEVGYIVAIDNKYNEEEMQPVTRGQIEEMYNKFSQEDKELISIMERAYNGYCRDLKYDTDMKRLGFSNVFEGYYYPINRIGATDFDTDDFFQMMERVSNIPANKSRVKGAKNAIIVSNALTKFMRHVNAVARYANLAIPVENMNRVFNLDISGDKHMPTSIKRELKKNDLWKGAEDYMKRLTDDVQQIGVKPDGGSKTIAWLRGNYAKFQLGANPKVWFTQISSYFASFGELRASSLAKAAAIDGSDVDKYCRLAAIRHYDKAATKAQSLTDKAGNVLSAPIESVDRGVIRKLFAACQAEAQARYKLEIGTEENKIKAGEILTEVILKTQQNQLITEQSAAMRSTSEIIKSFTMFSADSMKLLSRFVQYMGEVATLNKRIKAAKAKGDTALAEQLTAQRNKAVKSLVKSSVSILAVSVWMAALAKLFKLLYNKDDEEETVAEWLGEGTLGNIIGMVPFIRDAYSYFADGYDTDIFVTSMANDVLKSLSKTRDIFTAWVSGENVTSEQFYSNIRSLAYSFGQIFGLPTRNVYNFTTGIIRRIDEGTGKSIDAWFKEPSESDAKASLREGIEDRDDSLTEYGLNQMYKKYDVETSDSALKRELDRLIKLNVTKDEDDNTDYSPLGFKIPENLKIDGEDVELSVEDRKVFKNGLKSAEKLSADMVKTYYYKKLSDKYKAYAIRKVFEYYDLMSRETVGAVPEERARLLYYGEAVGIDMLAVLLAYKQELNAVSDEEKTRRGKSTKELITEYLKRFNLTPVQKSLVLRALGYSDKDNDKLVKSFIERRPGLSKEQKAEFLEMAKVS